MKVLSNVSLKLQLRASGGNIFFSVDVITI